MEKEMAGVWDITASFGSPLLVDENGGVEFIVNDDLSSLDAFYITIQGQVV